eukprot:EG_transcript_30339
MTNRGESNDLWTLQLPPKKLDSSKPEWKQLCAKSECGDGIYKRAGHTAVVYGEQMFVFGGRSKADGSMNDLWVFNFGQKSSLQWEMVCSSLQYLLWGQCNSPPGVRYGHSAVMFGSKMVVFGGRVGNHETEANDVWFIDVAASKPQWDQVCSGQKDDCGASPSPRSYHGAAVWKSSMLVFGGGSWMANDLWSLDLSQLDKP